MFSFLLPLGDRGGWPCGKRGSQDGGWPEFMGDGRGEGPNETPQEENKKMRHKTTKKDTEVKGSE